MRFSQIYGQNSPVISLEFFPPKEADGLERTLGTIRRLKKLKPAFMTVTYGAGGSTKALTREIVSFIHNELKTTAIAHLTCVGHTKPQIDQIVEELSAEGIRNILALRGDPPQGTDKFVPTAGGFSCARDLLSHLSSRKEFSFAVAGYPESHREALSPEDDLLYLKSKVDAGAEVVLTQLFFDVSVYFSFVKRARAIGISVPIVPGIMPIRDVAQIKRFTGMCGASLPEAMLSDLAKIEGDSAAVSAFGVRYALKMCQQLIEGGAPGIHLYTLNRSSQVEEILSQL